MITWTTELARGTLNTLGRFMSRPEDAKARAAVRRIETQLGLGRLLDEHGTWTEAARELRAKLEGFLRASEELPQPGRGVRSRDRTVLVVGSAHLDVYCDYDPAGSDVLDKIGDVTIWVGGCGYNVAANLARRQVPTALYTYLPPWSVASDFVERQCHSLGVNTRFLLRAGVKSADPAFVGYRCAGELAGAVTSTLVDKVPLDEAQLRPAVEESCLVVAECNLTHEQVRLVARVAKALAKPLFLAGVSEPKAGRVLEAYREDLGPWAFELFAVNEREADKVFPLSWRETASGAWCRHVRSKNVLVTRGAAG